MWSLRVRKANTDGEAIFFCVIAVKSRGGVCNILNHFSQFISYRSALPIATRCFAAIGQVRAAGLGY